MAICTKYSEFFKSLETVDDRLCILCCGSTGVGKSTLLNGLLGVDVLEVGMDLARSTTEVQNYTITRGGVTITVWDTPSLEGSNNDRKYLEEIKGKCADHDIFLYCIDSSEPRALDLVNRKSSLIKFTKLFGVELWNNAIIVLTQANSIEVCLQEEAEHDPNFDVTTEFKCRIDEWKKEIHETLEKAGVYKTVPIALAGAAASPDLPGCPYWASKTFQMCADQMKYKKLLCLVKASGSRLKLKMDVNREDISRLKIEDQPLVISPEDAGRHSLMELDSPEMIAVSSFLLGALAVEVFRNTPVGFIAGVFVGGLILTPGTWTNGITSRRFRRFIQCFIQHLVQEENE